jgi:3-dehydrosphinganine reductase
MFMPQELERQDMDEIKWMVDINLMGTFHLIKAVLPDMKARTRAKCCSLGGYRAKFVRCLACHAAKVFNVMLVGWENLFVGNIFAAGWYLWLHRILSEQVCSSGIG